MHLLHNCYDTCAVLCVNRIMILDEIDQLSSKHQEVLYHIFEWPSLPGSKVILLGKYVYI